MLLDFNNMTGYYLPLEFMNNIFNGHLVLTDNINVKRDLCA